MVSSLVGATLDADFPSPQIGQASRVIAVVLDGKEIARTTVEFAKLD